MRFPTRNDLAITLSTLLSSEVAVAQGLVPNRSLIGHCSYDLLDGRGVQRAVVSVELPLAHALGAAIALVAPSNVSNAAPDRYLLECAREVVNVVVGQTAVVNDMDLHIDPAADGRRPWSAPLPDASYRISLPGYSSGVMAMNILHRSSFIMLDDYLPLESASS